MTTSQFRLTLLAFIGAGVLGGLVGAQVTETATGRLRLTDGPCVLRSGTGSPEGVVTGNVCALFFRDDGGAATTVHVKESGTGSTGWQPLSSGGGGSATWSSLLDPSGNLSRGLGTNTSLFTVSGNTGASVMYRLIDTTGNTGTGYLFEVGSQGTSTINPFRVQVQGSDMFQVTADDTVRFDGQFWSEEIDAGNCTGAVTIDWDLGTGHACTLTGNVTLTLSNPEANGHYSIILNQDATGSHTVTWPAAVLFAGGSSPALGGANQKNICALVFSDENGGEYYATCTLNVS